MNNDTWRADVWAVALLLRFHRLQVDTTPLVAYNCKPFQRHDNRKRVALNEYLQPHVQSIEAGEAEKTVLGLALSQSQHTMKQKAVGTEEVRDRLKALREKII